MGRVYAEAEIMIDQDFIADPLRKRSAEGEIGIESLPGFSAEPGEEFEINVKDMQELVEFMSAVQEGDEETVRKYLVTDGGE